MSEKSLSMEMGNLVCRFGNEKVLLDMSDEIVFPCFFDNTLVRSYDKTSYFFHDVSLVLLSKSKSENVIGIAGRYIKDTTLEREQIFEEGKGLIRDTGSLRSSPSALFLLILNNHRLVYVKETKDAPPKESFRSTLLSFLRTKHKQHIESEFKRYKTLQEADPERERVTKKDLYESTPRPTLELIPLTSEDSIEQFVRKYSILKTIEISLSDRNDENDNDPFFEELQKRKDAIGSTNSVVKHNNSKGLDKDEAIHEIAEATEQGNQAVKLVGIDNEGDILRGNNEKFQLRKPLEDLSSMPAKAANELYNSFVGLVEDGLVKIPETSQRAKVIIESLIHRLF
ncbi:MAG: hypothetical protein AB2826_26245 [Candidatus Thiodiazotropha sp.]